ncbi:Phosphoglycerate mutase-like protein [Venustampulla echinocandica]|uniref:Phosphoglycerate mutase-like protein n=1 Tax=Venustampulla echinocandica TaxID=2656787 RepID=A0A370TNE9_9HELO|nr:Phosphoglycerate mutase-like protein [Venustampulla echinocandica]RDL37050.1 Phosphoglycerate mutase-like protein [Venustampulla echinocandica]
MAKTYLHLVRHAQGFHNLNAANHSLPDPDLTPLGEKQCETLSQIFPYHSKITHLIASPLRRTLYTALLSFPAAVKAGHKLLAVPELQETSDLPCDTGSSPAALKAEFEGNPKWNVDLSRVQEGWNVKTGKYAPTASAISSRALEARLFLRSLASQSSQAASGEDVHIVVVTHGGYLHYFTEDWDGESKFCGTGWANTEFRSYEFSGGEEDENAGLRELEESRERRKAIPLTGDEKRELNSVAEGELGGIGNQVNGNGNAEGEKTKL